MTYLIIFLFLETNNTNFPFTFSPVITKKSIFQRKDNEKKKYRITINFSWRIEENLLCCAISAILQSQNWLSLFKSQKNRIIKWKYFILFPNWLFSVDCFVLHFTISRLYDCLFCFERKKCKTHFYSEIWLEVVL